VKSLNRDVISYQPIRGWPFNSYWYSFSSDRKLFYSQNSAKVVRC